MARPSKTESKAGSFSRRYQAALRRYLKQRGRAKPASAVALGREAVALGLEILDLAMTHEKTLLAQAISIEPAAARDRIVRRTGKFFPEAIIPMEETDRTVLEANAHLGKLNQALKQRARRVGAGIAAERDHAAPGNDGEH